MHSHMRRCRHAGHFLPHFAHATRASSSSDMDGLHSSGSLSNDMTQAAPLDLPPKHLYTCTVGRNRSQARYCSVLHSRTLEELHCGLRLDAAATEKEQGVSWSVSGSIRPELRVCQWR